MDAALKRPDSPVTQQRHSMQRIVRRLEESGGDMRCQIELEDGRSFIGFRFDGTNVPEHIAKQVRALMSPNDKVSDAPH